MESDAGEVGSRCTGCNRLLAQTVDECPACHAKCEKTNLWQAIALFAARKHVTVHFVEPGHGLENTAVSSRCSRARRLGWARPNRSWPRRSLNGALNRLGMASPLGRGPRSIAFFAVAVVTAMLGARIDVVAGQQATAPRLREARIPTQMPQALGGGEVVLEVTVDRRGGVTRVDR